MTAEHEGGAQKERSFEIGKDEAWFANVKRTYDEFQQESLETIRHMRTHFDKMVSDAQQYDNQRQVIANQALQNAVETANMVGKQNVRHVDIATDRTWNVDEQGWTVDQILKNETFTSAVAAAVAKAVQDVSSKKG